MTVKFANLAQKCLIERIERLVFALSCAKSCQSAQKSTDGHLQVPRCDSAEMQATRIVLLSSELQKRLSQFLARICVFAGIKYPHKLYFGRPVCVACHGLTAKVFFWHEPLWLIVTFLSLHQILRIESQPMADCVHKISKVVDFARLFNSTLSRVNNNR